MTTRARRLDPVETATYSLIGKYSDAPFTLCLVLDEVAAMNHLLACLPKPVSIRRV